jgi:hypothetical protein
VSSDPGAEEEPEGSRGINLPDMHIDGASGVQVGTGNVQFNAFYGSAAGPASSGTPPSPHRSLRFPGRGHAFISYVREDAREVDGLQEALEAAGVRVWRDTADLWPGEDWRARIREAITGDALVFIACFSRQSAARQRTYQNEELTLAVEELRQRRPDHPWLIPVRLDNCAVPDVPLGGGRTLASVQRADLFGPDRDQAVRRLVTAVQRMLHQPVPPAAPAGRPTPGEDGPDRPPGPAPAAAHEPARPAGQDQAAAVAKQPGPAGQETGFAGQDQRATSSPSPDTVRPDPLARPPGADRGDLRFLAGRARRPWRLLVAAAVVLAIAGSLAGLYAAGTFSSDNVLARGDIAIVREDGNPRLIFPLAAGGIAYCTRGDDLWSQPWPGIRRSPGWPGIARASIFFSTFHGFEVLGDNDGVLTFGYRDNAFRWHDPKPLLDDESSTPIQGVAGKPAFFEYQGEPQFLALVPVDSGGLVLYRRVGISQDWHMMGRIDSDLGRITSVALTYLPSAGISVILRVGSRLYEQSRGTNGLPGRLASGWSSPQEVVISNGEQPQATGDPALIYSDVIGNVADNTFWLAVPTRHGLAMLSTRNAVSGQWSSEFPPLHQRPDSVALLEGYADGRPDLEVVYRRGSALYSLWQPDGGTWHGPTRIRC